MPKTPAKIRKRPRAQAIRRARAITTSLSRSGALPTARRLWGPGDDASTTAEELAFWEALPLDVGTNLTDPANADNKREDAPATPHGDTAAAENAMHDAAKALEAETAAMFKARWGFDLIRGEPVPDGGGSRWTWSPVEA
ncbi:hypothetical protein MMPV_006016 [Pyropia vietnamensis]